jgi:hypothetical protein
MSARGPANRRRATAATCTVPVLTSAGGGAIDGELPNRIDVRPQQRRSRPEGARRSGDSRNRRLDRGRWTGDRCPGPARGPLHDDGRAAGTDSSEPSDAIVREGMDGLLASACGAADGSTPGSSPTGCGGNIMTELFVYRRAKTRSRGEPPPSRRSVGHTWFFPPCPSRKNLGIRSDRDPPSQKDPPDG